MSKQYQHALIIGGSIAGLAAARVLSHYFERVTIIERDDLPEGNEFRSGVPQNRQPHALLTRGLQELETLFPGFGQQLEANGAVSLDFGHNVEWFAFGRWRPHYDPGLLSLSSSRPLLEGTIRRRLLSDPHICAITHSEVAGLVSNDDNSRIIGVRIRSRGTQSVEDVIQADLVVDASGRASHSAQWLHSLGYGTVRTSSINAFPGYASRIYERPDNMDCMMMYIQPTPPDTRRGAIILPLEDNRIHLCLIGMAKDYPPTDEADFMNFLASLPDSRMYGFIQEARPVSAIAGYRRAENVLKHYDEMAHWPDNFVALGDSVYAFNPVYGQGMTVAILAARLLGECLQAQSAEHLAGMSTRFQKALIKVITFPWQVSTGEDMRWLPVTEIEGCPARPDMATAFRMQFLKKVMIASTKDPKVAEAFYRVMNMVATPTAFFQPRMMARVLAA